MKSVGVFVLMIVAVVTVIYINLEKPAYRFHEKWQFRMFFFGPHIITGLCVLYQLVAMIVMIICKRELVRLNEVISRELVTRKRIIDQSFRQQMAVS